MNKRTISISVLVALGFFSLVWWGRNNQTTLSDETSSEEKSSLVAGETLYDFGTISMKDGNVTKEFTITNPTDKDITVKTVITSCMCTTAFLVESDGKTKGPFGMPGHGGFVPPVNERIGSGEGRIIRVVYDPNAHGPAGVGPVDRFIDLTEMNQGTLRLEIKAMVTP